MGDMNESISKESEKKVNIDTIIIEDIGQFGWYQLRMVLLLSLAVLFIGIAASEYIFTAARIPTRCLIPECEYHADDIEFVPEWLSNAVPRTGSGFDNCQRFVNTSYTVVESDEEQECPAQLFEQSTIVGCDKYVYENTNTVVYDFNLACDEWRRTLIGSVRTIGIFVAMTMLGFISDRWGRRTALAITSINTSCIGALRYFATTYNGFMISQFAESAFGGGGFSCSFIIINETIGPKYRLVASALMNTCFAFGQGLFGLVAWAVPNWRHLTLTIYLPMFISISYFWIIPETARWYMSKERYDDAEKVLKNIARVNGKVLSEQKLVAMRYNAEEEKKKENLKQQEQGKEPWLVILVFQNKPILLRCLISPIWWITMTFVYYGLTINSVNISGNSYINFMAVSFVEIPGFWLGYFLMESIGRKPSLIITFWLCAACQFTYLFMPNDLYALSLAVFLLGKCASAAVTTSVYVYTTELYPTKYRHRLFAFSSMIGRIGAILAPLTPAFGDELPYLLFGCFALFAGLLVFLTPETRGMKLPDTMKEAVDTGK